MISSQPDCSASARPAAESLRASAGSTSRRLTAAAIARYWHKNAFGRVAGRLYIAWCVAAVTLPILAGWLYDRTGGYGTAVVIAGALNLLACAISLRLPKTPAR